MIRRLGGDADWCNTIVWSADGSTVAYLVQDARLVTVDAASGSIVSEKWLTDWKGEYPPGRVVRGLALSAGRPGGPSTATTRGGRDGRASGFDTGVRRSDRNALKKSRGQNVRA